MGQAVRNPSSSQQLSEALEQEVRRAIACTSGEGEYFHAQSANDFGVTSTVRGDRIALDIFAMIPDPENNADVLPEVLDGEYEACCDAVEKLKQVLRETGIDNEPKNSVDERLRGHLTQFVQGLNAFFQQHRAAPISNPILTSQRER